ncbi:aminopeptidase [Wenxinia saemankumensis]|uniref:Aminopeptidase T. Metallo peptidase. MEROPS family M29 n=1 Tax=Wenxinia saemankumensis TaxID=1447782 RepID=A0A1M6E5Y1_9RHOB|nr:aminopeptidase [Wenxinia saemankumensis]SHI80907.1 aminopeptidase T. Metallo peptidase. MEROPS family M29 [Wenxinia saemankumensis]
MTQTDTALPFDAAQLDRLAEVAIRVGVGLRPGQDLIVTADAAALPLLRRIAKVAYREGAGLVTPMISDSAITRARYEMAADHSFDRAPGWLYDGMASAYGDNSARLHIVSDDPMLLADQDTDKVARAGKALNQAYTPARKMITGFQTNWSICAYPAPSWARLMFPDMAEDAAVAKLAEAIFAASRADREDPVAAWNAHNAELLARRKWLDDHRFHSLHYSGPGTDLTIGLADDHRWKGGKSTSKKGVDCNPNIPTEEVFTTPHRERVSGIVRATKPLAHQGSLIEGIEVRFEGGRIVEAKASKGEEVFLKLIDNDEGARRLGEVALVPASSPISASGLLFYNTLFDENAASHIALGQCYADCFTDTKMSDEEIAARGGNSSMIHVDWMIGSTEIDIDGLDADGGRTPVMRGGEWAQAL